MTTKTYKIEGIGGKYSIFLRYSDKSKLVQFKRHFTDMVFTTSDSELQAAIEATNEFKTKMIVVDAVETVADEDDGGDIVVDPVVVNPPVTPVVVDPVVVNPPVTPVVVEPVVVNPPVTPVVVDPVVVNPPVTPVVVEPVVENLIIDGPKTVQEAKDWLKANKGIAPVALNNVGKVKAQAEKAGVTFPNVVWPE